MELKCRALTDSMDVEDMLNVPKTPFSKLLTDSLL